MVVSEPAIPFAMSVLYEDERIIVVDKPHFLASTPRGMWYRETALIRLREQYDEPDIVPAHRLDRMTAGVLLFVRNPEYRGAYQTLFQNRQIEKTYECLAACKPLSKPKFGTVEQLEKPQPFPLVRRSHITKLRGTFAAYEEAAPVNAVTRIERCEMVAGGRGEVPLCRYVLHPLTGKTHQLRVHMNAIGLPILGDDFYPVINKRDDDDFRVPLQLVARDLSFVDPVTGEQRRFVSKVALDATR